MRKIFFNNIHAITLAELITVVVVIAITATIFIPVYTKTINQEREKEALAVLESIAYALVRAYTNNDELYYVKDTIPEGNEQDINDVLGLRIPASPYWRYCVKRFTEGNMVQALATRDDGSLTFVIELTDGESYDYESDFTEDSEGHWPQDCY